MFHYVCTDSRIFVGDIITHNAAEQQDFVPLSILIDLKPAVGQFFIQIVDFFPWKHRVWCSGCSGIHLRNWKWQDHQSTLSQGTIIKRMEQKLTEPWMILLFYPLLWRIYLFYYN